MLACESAAGLGQLPSFIPGWEGQCDTSSSDLMTLKFSSGGVSAGRGLWERNPPHGQVGGDNQGTVITAMIKNEEGEWLPKQFCCISVSFYCIDDFDFGQSCSSMCSLYCLILLASSGLMSW